MAKVKIQGNASGTGVITLIAPNTNTDRTVTLPDESITLGGGVDGIVSTANATAITIDSSENVGIGKSSAIVATLHIDPATNVTTSFGSPLMKVGGDNSWGGNGSTYTIGLGYANGATVKSPVEVGMETTSATGVTKGSFVVATRDVTTDTAPTKRLEITSDGRGLSQFTARMWCNLNGTGTIAIRDSHNVSSIADGGTGFFTVYIDNDMANSNHVHFVTAQQDSSGNFGGDIDYFGGLRRTPRATGGVDLSCQQGMTNPVDPQYLMVVVFGE